MQDNILIEMKGVQKWYGGYQALRDVDLTVRKGEKIVLCGPSGSGKSTLIRVSTASSRSSRAASW